MEVLFLHFRSVTDGMAPHCGYPLSIAVWTLGVLLSSRHSDGLNNGLALTPPMGWLPWARFMCAVECGEKNKSASCISEALFMQMAEAMVSNGFLAAGYDRINLDDCYLHKRRSTEGQLQADPTRFPHGLKWLGEQIHKKGLRFGIYENLGEKTCMGYPGSLGHLKRDAETFAEWGADMVKLDGCFTDPKHFDSGYTAMGEHLNKTGRPMVFSCSWPYYVKTVAKAEPNYELIKKTCNIWRNFDDIQLNFKSIISIIDFYDRNQDDLRQFHGPGHWNDPDMLIVGNPGLTVNEAKVQFAIWCIWAAPLLMSNDLRDIQPEFKNILLNRRLIAIDQDPLGTMGKLEATMNGVKVYVKAVTPTFRDATGGIVYSYAIALHNTKTTKANFDLRLEQVGVTHSEGYNTQELFSGDLLGHFLPSEVIKVAIDATSAVMLKATVVMLESSDGPLELREPEGKAIGSSYSRSILILAAFCLIFLLMSNRRKCCRLMKLR